MELCELEQVTARFQAVVSSLLTPDSGAQFLTYSPQAVRIAFNADVQRKITVQVLVLRSQGEDPAALKLRVQPLLAELVASRRESDKTLQPCVIVVTPPADADAVDAMLRAVCAETPHAPALQALQVSSNGAVRPQPSAALQEVGVVLRAPPRPLVGPEPEAEFAARCQQLIEQTCEKQERLRDFMQRLKRRPLHASVWLLVLNLLMFALTYAWGNPDQPATLSRMGVISGERILAGQWWRLLAGTVLHQGPVHLVLNLTALVYLGIWLERLVGSARFFSLYVVSGLGGALCTIAGDKGVISEGASGAICGVAGALAVLGMWPRGDLPERVAQVVKRLGVWTVVPTMMMSALPKIDWRSHLGGMLCGAVLALLGLLRPTVMAQVQPPRWRRFGQLLLATAATAALLGSIVVALWRGQPWILIHPERRHRIALTGTPLSIEVPRSFGTGVPRTGSEGSIALAFDDPFEYPAELTIKAAPTPPLNAALRQQGAEALWEEVQQLAAEKPGTTISRLTVGEFPTVSASGPLPSGLRVQMFVQLRAHYRVTLRMRTLQSTPPRMLPELPALLATLRDESR